MFKAFLLISVVCFTLTSAITPTELGQCVEANCTTPISVCESDTACNASLACFESCALGNQTCYDACATPVANNVAYWGLSICSMTCMANLEVAEGDPLQQCLANCSSETTACMNDSVCLSAVNCVDECQGNYECEAACIVPDENDVTLMELIGCEGQCLSSFLSQ